MRWPTCATGAGTSAGDWFRVGRASSRVIAAYSLSFSTAAEHRFVASAWVRPSNCILIKRPSPCRRPQMQQIHFLYICWFNQHQNNKVSGEAFFSQNQWIKKLEKKKGFRIQKRNLKNILEHTHTHSLATLCGTHVQLIVITNIYLVNYMTATRCIYAWLPGQFSLNKQEFIRHCAHCLGWWLCANSVSGGHFLAKPLGALIPIERCLKKTQSTGVQLLIMFLIIEADFGKNWEAAGHLTTYLRRKSKHEVIWPLVYFQSVGATEQKYGILGGTWKTIKLEKPIKFLLSHLIFYVNHNKRKPHV